MTSALEIVPQIRAVAFVLARVAHTVGLVALVLAQAPRRCVDLDLSMTDIFLRDMNACDIVALLYYYAT